MGELNAKPVVTTTSHRSRHRPEVRLPLSVMPPENAAENSGWTRLFRADFEQEAGCSGVLFKSVE
jgi:hypothetical protein